MQGVGVVRVDREGRFVEAPLLGALRAEGVDAEGVDADVVVYPSTDEVFGLVPFEGLMCGAPVVVGGDCGCGQLIGAAGAGLLMRHSEVHGLRARIRTLLDDPAASRAMVARGRRYIEARLSFEVVAREHRALYAQVMRDYGSRSGA